MITCLIILAILVIGIPLFFVALDIFICFLAIGLIVKFIAWLLRDDDKKKGEE
jgi:hypothetical protein